MSVRVFVRNLQKYLRIPLKLVRSIAVETLEVSPKNSDSALSIVFINDKRMRKLNRLYTGRDDTTDVLAFSLKDSDETQEPLLGEVFVNAQLACERASRVRNSSTSEALLYLVHGILHLKGYDDHTPQKRRIMWRKTRKILSRFGYEV